MALAAMCAVVATVLLVSQRVSAATELSEAHAMALALGNISPQEATEIAKGGTELDALRTSVDAARQARQNKGGPSMRVSAGRDQLQQLQQDERAADEAAAAAALQNYIAQEASLPGAAVPVQAEEQPRMGARTHFKWDKVADKAVSTTHVLRQQFLARPRPAVGDADRRMQSNMLLLAKKSPPPMSEAFTIGIDKTGRLDKQGVRAFLESNGNPQAAQRALVQERDHVGDEEVTGGDDTVPLHAADKHPKDEGVRNLFEGLTDQSGW